MSKIKVLVVDDSSTMRTIISSLLNREADIEVVATANDPFEARELIKTLNPDVVTLDVEMPRMSGTEFLGHLMRLRPMPVVMVSTLTAAGSDEAVLALELGAVDCVLKPSHADPGSFNFLPEKIRCAFGARNKIGRERQPAAAPSSAQRFSPAGVLVAIGSSTGGVEALQTVISSFPENCSPTVVTQHMPPKFTKTLAERLNKTCAPKVLEATDGARLLPGHVYIAPGGASHLTVQSGMCRLKQDDLVNGHRPSVDVLFGSVASSLNKNAIGVILTGMGSDGAQGLLELKRSGAMTIGQDEDSSIVYGMPKAAMNIGAVAKQLPLAEIGPEIVSLTNSITKESQNAVCKTA